MVRLSNPCNLLSTFFGISTLSWMPAPGTVASLLSVIPWYILSNYCYWRTLFIILILVTILGCYVCHYTNENIGVHDHRCIVLDECIGMWFLLVLFPGNCSCFSLSLFFGFIFFRVFDICKPWPISFIDRNIRNGLGIVFDDILSALVSVFLVYLLKNLYCL